MPNTNVSTSLFVLGSHSRTDADEMFREISFTMGLYESHSHSCPDFEDDFNVPADNSDGDDTSGYGTEDGV